MDGKVQVEGPGETVEEWQGLIAPFLAGHWHPITSARSFSRYPDSEKKELSKPEDSLHPD